MKELVLVTGGAGFIGSHLAEELLARGKEVRILDVFDPQVHDTGGRDVAGAQIIRADIEDRASIDAALDGVSSVVHFAAAVGVGQSMYEIASYCRTNVMGTAHLLEAMTARPGSVRKLLVASSMSIYGEGLYGCPSCGAENHDERQEADLVAGRWEALCPTCKTEMAPKPTPETKPVTPRSVYAVTKRDQEELCLSVGRAYDIPTVALRFFNVYGPEQALGNPYTGVAAIFASRLLAGAPPLVFEDGRQSRDFIHVKDIARACALALDNDGADGLAVNVGTARSTSVLEMAEILRSHLGGPEPEILGSYRKGDIRHCFADHSLITDRLGWEPQTALEDGIVDLIAWVKTQTGHADRVDKAYDELRAHGLVR